MDLQYQPRHHAYTFHFISTSAHPRNAHTHSLIRIPLSLPPTFVPIVGTDSEYGEAYVSILVHINFIGCLCKCRLVIVHVADKNANICRV